ncbi:uncharacterized protein F5891DRAFT_946416 [Suillus fuscotomentosus]|uniref:Uncharacterized protein n=1 Tax=Suillus fuscotomentosus TaxID=1912939 RepID=A0AAD4ED25_9AGAM|nr:uncharacterized protein F5891DRAFT_946416 [Suillus fuscotomentosus]KAG1904014.1 hypothetical protein F5891DRAFT_946416 [Suillus fuscotomentosus]
MAESSTNSLGLDFNNLSIKETTEPPQADADESQVLENQSTDRDVKEKKKPYVNLERVKTGGAQREKLSEEALAERMQRIKEQNEKIKQRRIDVQADEDAFKKTQEADRVRQAHQRKVQEGVNRTREQNALRKLDKIQNREWDSGKPPGDWKQARNPAPADRSAAVPSSSPSEHRGGRGRGSSRGGPSRSRGRGRGGPSVAGFSSPSNSTQVADTSSSINEATPVASEEPEAVGIAS